MSNTIDCRKDRIYLCLLTTGIAERIAIDCRKDRIYLCLLTTGIAERIAIDCRNISLSTYYGGIAERIAIDCRKDRIYLCLLTTGIAERIEYSFVYLCLRATGIVERIEYYSSYNCISCKRHCCNICMAYSMAPWHCCNISRHSLLSIVRFSIHLFQIFIHLSEHSTLLHLEGRLPLINTFLYAFLGDVGLQNYFSLWSFTQCFINNNNNSLILNRLSNCFISF